MATTPPIPPDHIDLPSPQDVPAIDTPSEMPGVSEPDTMPGGEDIDEPGQGPPEVPPEDYPADQLRPIGDNPEQPPMTDDASGQPGSMNDKTMDK
jgi:hypothetical protein